MANLKAMVLGIVGLFLLAALGPSAITQLAAANTSTWSATDVTLWGIVATMAIIGFILMVLGPAID